MRFVMSAGSRLRILATALVCSAALAGAQSPPRPETPKQSDVLAPSIESIPENSELGRATPTDPLSEIPIEEWLRGPVRKNFAWDVQVLRPVLTFDQRHLLRVVVTFRAGNVRKAGLSAAGLLFVMKLAGEDGHWFPGDSHGRLHLQTDPSPGDKITSLFSAYLHSGTYQIALIAYDPHVHKGNLWRGRVRVASVNGDPLPDIDRSVPAVEFLRPAPPLPGGHVLSHDPWTFGHGSLTLPVRNADPLEVDLVANLSLSDTTRTHNAEAPDWFYQINAAVVSEVSRVLSQMTLERGCIRVTAMDIARQKVFADREATNSFDWSNIRTALAAWNRGTIEAHVLAGEKKTPAFLADYLEQYAADSARCGKTTEKPPKRVLIVVSDAVLFPNGTEMVQASPTRAWARCFYLELVPAAGPRWDQIGAVLKPLNPVRLEISKPAEFRTALARLIHEIEKVAANAGENN
jgi:hypothetical protein